MVHSEVYLSKYVVSIAPFSTPACPDCSQNIQKTAFLHVFCFIIFHPFFQGGQLTPFAPMCGRACVGRKTVTPRLRNDLYCVGWGVKLYSNSNSKLNQSIQRWQAEVTKTRLEKDSLPSAGKSPLSSRRKPKQQ